MFEGPGRYTGRGLVVHDCKRLRVRVCLDNLIEVFDSWCFTPFRAQNDGFSSVGFDGLAQPFAEEPVHVYDYLVAVIRYVLESGLGGSGTCGCKNEHVPFGLEDFLGLTEKLVEEFLEFWTSMTNKGLQHCPHHSRRNVGGTR